MHLQTILAEAQFVQGVLDETMIQAITNGFSTLTATISQVLAIAVPASVGVICLTAGIRYALKKVRGVISSAA